MDESADVLCPLGPLEGFMVVSWSQSVFQKLIWNTL